MASGSSDITPPGIAALPPTTVSLLGSGQVLTDPASIVKELIDNALDARAKSIFVEISANTLDNITVKDDGHGIPADDRHVACRRYCTSKIRDPQDLRNTGGKWLGFRGEALSCVAEMSGSISIITRVDGEPVAVNLTYDRNGELSSLAHESHPIGTTVRVSKLFERTPVRKQIATKSATNIHSKIRKLMQAYALARLAVRFRLRVLKAQNNKGDFIYAPSPERKLEDAVCKVIGKDCALQCDWMVFSDAGFEIQAFLPKASANASKISNQDVFISVDARPVSSNRGIFKTIVAAYKERIRKSGPSLAGVRDPFMYMHIVCPPGSYDSNIEPTKDDVLFENSEAVMNAVHQVLVTYYPDMQKQREYLEPTTSARQFTAPDTEIACEGSGPGQFEPTEQSINTEGCTKKRSYGLPQWRPTMHDVDEEDFDPILGCQPPLFVEEEGSRSAEVSNPWTIARMNAAMKPGTLIDNEQLLSPTKSQKETFSSVSSPLRLSTPERTSSTHPLTPSSAIRDTAPHHSNHRGTMDHIHQINLPDPARHKDAFVTHFDRSSQEIFPRDDRERHTNPAQIAHRPTKRRLTVYPSETFKSPAKQSNDLRCGRPIRGSMAASQPCEQRRNNRTMRTTGDNTPTPHNVLFSTNNTDIRSFFGGNDKLPPESGSAPVTDSFSVPMDPRRCTRHPGQASSPLATHPRVVRASSAGSQISMLFGSNNAFIEDLRGRPQSSGSVVRDPSGICELFNNSIHRSVSEGGERFMQSSTKPSFAPATRLVRDSLDGQEMDAYFRAIENRESPSPARTSSPIHNVGSSIGLAQSKPPTARQHRRRSTNSTMRTRSTNMPLERTLVEFQTQNTTYSLSVTAHDISRSKQKLDMRINSLEWSYAQENMNGAFGEPVFEQRIMSWVVKLDDLLDMLYGRLSGADTRCELHESIQRALDVRREAEKRYSAEYEHTSLLEVSSGSRMAAERDETTPTVDVDQHGGGLAKAHEISIDLTYVSNGEEDREEDGPKKPVQDEEVIEIKDEYDDDIDDEMLMGL